MQGENFHNFIKNAANDRLLLRGAGNGSVLINACPTCFPGYTSAYTELEKISKAGKSGPLQEFNIRLRYSLLESPLELIAYVVENDKPYSEILTADYEMMTPVMSKALGVLPVLMLMPAPWNSNREKRRATIDRMLR